LDTVLGIIQPPRRTGFGVFLSRSIVLPWSLETTSCQRLEESADLARHETDYGGDHNMKIEMTAQAKSPRRLWRYAERWCRWRRAGLDGMVSLKGGLIGVVIRQLRMLGIVGFPIPKYDAQTGTWLPQKTSASGWASAVARRW